MYSRLMSSALIAAACAASPAFARRIASGDYGEFDTATLLEVLYAPENTPDMRGFWLGQYTRQINSDKEEIRFDTDDLNEYRLAPFVAPNVQGRVLRSRGFDVKSFRPAYVKPKHVVDPARSIPRRAGEAPMGTLTRAQRFDAIVADNLRIERQVIENRWDWMAARATIDGNVTVIGEDYPATFVDFKRDPSLSAILVGASQWDSPTSSPLRDIQIMRTQSFKLSRAPINRLVFGLDAWSAFIDESHEDVLRLLNNQRNGNNSLFNANGISDGSPYEYQGQISGFQGGGRLDLWTYNHEYEEVDPVTGVRTFQPYMDQGTVVGTGNRNDGLRCFGAIADKRANLQPLDMFPKLWDQDDPSVTFTMTQSAPLMVPLRPNNSFKLKVVGSGGGP